MTRWAILGLAAALVLGALAVAGARALGASASRPALAVSVAAHWLGAWILWTFVTGLAARRGFLVAPPAGLFGVLALAGAAWHYRAHRRGGRERGLAVFVGVQLAWLGLLLLQNGVLGRPR